MLSSVGEIARGVVPGGVSGGVPGLGGGDVSVGVALPALKGEAVVGGRSAWGAAPGEVAVVLQPDQRWMDILEVLLTGRPWQILQRGGVSAEKCRKFEEADPPEVREARSPASLDAEVSHKRPAPEPNSAPSSATPVQRAQQRRKRYTDRTPSNHCHICSRSVGAVKMAVCHNLQSGLCRKVICKVCCESFQLGWSEYVAGGQWLCTHCQDKCPVRARCHTYHKTNQRRKAAGATAKKSETSKD